MSVNVSAGYPSKIRAWCSVVVLMLAYVLSFIDRQIINLLVGPIREDLAISDTQMSLLMGLSFALFYTVCGIPIGRLVDRRSRRSVVVVGIALWSAMTFLCGMAGSYLQLLLCRVGVSVGEASLSPSAYSIIADSFVPRLRATAMSVYAMGSFLGSGMAFLLGGLVMGFAAAEEHFVFPVLGTIRSWQLIFLLLGGVGLLFSLFILCAIREPRRQGVGAGQEMRLQGVLSYLRHNRKAVLCHNLGFACLAFAAYGSGAWTPTFFMRTYGWEPAQVGLLYGLALTICGSLGVIIGGRLSDFLLRRGHDDAPLRVGIISSWLGIPLTAAFLVSDGYLSLALISIQLVVVGMPFGVGPAAIQELVPNPMRGQATAIYLFVITIIGLGIGPTAVALATDYLFRDDLALRYSLVLTTATALLGGAVFLTLGLKSYRQGLVFLRAWEENPDRVKA
jgi:MFS family permease